MPNANVYNAVKGVEGLMAPLNKIQQDGTNNAEGVDDEVVGIYEPDLTEEEIISLTTAWENNYTEYDKKVKKKQKDSFDYWIGKHYPSISGLSENRSAQDNLIFEAVETFIPQATAADPEPVVKTDNTTEGNQIAKIYKDLLVTLTDKLNYRIKLKNIVRHWTLYFIGAAEVTWDPIEDEMDINRVNPRDLIFDPDATILEGGEYSGKYLGHRKENTASVMSDLFPKFKAQFEEAVHGELGTKIKYTKWSTPEYLFFTWNGKVLGKYYNPDWNYDGESTTTDPETGEEISEVIQGKNHFRSQKIPYIFLSVFNVGEHPHDDTSLVYQNLANQDMINTTLRQIIKNVKRMNNSLALSGKSFTKEQAAEAAQVIENGGALWVPDGPIGESYQKIEGTPLTPDVYQHLVDSRQETRNIFGTAGSNAQQLANDETVEGKARMQGNDSSRIGGGVSEYIEQFSSTFLNWCLQMMLVHYDRKHFVNLIGEDATKELEELYAKNPTRLIRASVKPGSMIPTDPMSERTEALKLWENEAIDPITLFKKLDFADPKEAAKQLYIWKTAPYMLFGDDPEIQKIMQQQQPTDTPKVSISFKDLPPSGQVGAAKLAGIQIDPKDLQAEDAQEKMLAVAEAQKDTAQAAKLHADILTPNKPTNPQ